MLLGVACQGGRLRLPTFQSDLPLIYLLTFGLNQQAKSWEAPGMFFVNLPAEVSFQIADIANWMLVLPNRRTF